MSEELKAMKQTLLAAAQSQMGNLDKVNAEELGEVIDMIKDIEEAEYYCAITKAMDDSKKEKEESEKFRVQSQQYYTPYYMRYLDPRYEDIPGYPGDGRMYYGGNNGGNGMGGRQSSSSNGGYNASASGNNARGFSDYGHQQYPPEMRDYREGRSPVSRRGYMESKEMHQDSGTQLHKLEKYINELSSDIVEMTADSTPEEKDLLFQKLTTLANRIQ